MNIFNRTYLKLTSVCLCFTLIFYFFSSLMMNYVLENNMELVFDVYYKKSVRILDSDIKFLKFVTEYLSKNEVVLDYLENSKDGKNVEGKKEGVLNQIGAVEKLVYKISFVDSIKIFDLKNNYVFNKRLEEENFYITKRPWYNKDFFSKEDRTKITKRYLSYVSGKDEISIVSNIYDRRDNDFLGFIILDISVDNLLNYINKTFDENVLESFIYSYYTDSAKLDIDKNKYNIYINKELLNNGEDLVFKFDKKELLNNSLAKEDLRNIRIILLIIGTIISIFLFITIRICFGAALMSIKKLKDILHKLDDSCLIEERNEFRQLELLADSLNKTFDDKIYELIHYDSLTNLPNRKSLEYICEKNINANIPFAIVFIDLNKFKNINDVFGHHIGDEYLNKFSSILKELIKDKGVATRYSGDEFIIVYENYVSDEEFLDFYNKKFIDIFSKPIKINDTLTTDIQFSVGVSVYPRDGNSFEELINKSDFMMYVNKKNKVNIKISFFDEKMYEELLYIQKIKSELKFALLNNEFYLNYQPIIDKNSKILKAETLIRWNNKELGFIPPDKFINYLEETRQIIEVGYWIIEQVCRDLKTIQIYNENLQISINISALQLMLKDFVPEIIKILDRYNISYNNICFEITETVLLDNKDNVLENINKIKDLGISLSLDDFGTGYSSFNYLRTYKLDFLKIDKSFLKNSDSDDYNLLKLDYDIINQIKEISHLLDIEVIMEGVETREQFNVMRDIGIDYVQGYYFSKPLCLKDFEDKLKG